MPYLAPVIEHFRPIRRLPARRRRSRRFVISAMYFAVAIESRHRVALAKSRRRSAIRPRVAARSKLGAGAVISLAPGREGKRDQPGSARFKASIHSCGALYDAKSASRFGCGGRALAANALRRAIRPAARHRNEQLRTATAISWFAYRFNRRSTQLGDGQKPLRSIGSRARAGFLTWHPGRLPFRRSGLVRSVGRFSHGRKPPGG